MSKLTTDPNDDCLKRGVDTDKVPQNDCYLILSEEAVFHYKWSYIGPYPDVKDQISVKWNDPKIGINWHIDNPILSKRDENIILL